MPLSEDSRALLQLLLVRRQSYEDLAGLLGCEPAEVHERAATALAEIGGRDPDAGAGLTDFLLGRADPIERATVVKHLAADDDDNRLAHELRDSLSLLAPSASLPDLPPEPGGKRRRPAGLTRGPGVRSEPSPPRGNRAGAGSTLSRSQRTLIAGLLGGALAIAVAVILITGVFSSGDGGDGSAAGPKPTQAVIVPVGGASGHGRVELARNGNTPVLNVAVSGLDPAPKGHTYWLWLYKSKKVAIQVVPLRIDASGDFAQTIQVPTTVLAYIANGTLSDVVVSLSDDSELAAASKRVGAKGLPPFTGKMILRGPLSGPLTQVLSSGAAGAGGTRSQ